MKPAVRTLIVDGDRAFALRVADQLRDDPEEVEVKSAIAGTIADGLTLANQGDWQVIVLEVRLPDGSGLAALPELRVRSPNAAIIVVTDFRGIPYQAIVKHLGAVAFLPKPDLMAQLPALVRVLAARQRPDDP